MGLQHMILCGKFLCRSEQNSYISIHISIHISFTSVSDTVKDKGLLQILLFVDLWIFNQFYHLRLIDKMCIYIYAKYAHIFGNTIVKTRMDKL